MSLRCDGRLRHSLVVVALLGAVFTHRAEAAPIKVCIDQANPTASMDRRMVRAVAKSQGVTIEEVPFVGFGKGDDGFPPSRFAKMAQSDCALIMGFPVDESKPNLPANVMATLAYARTGFALISRASSKRLDLADLPKGSEVGIAQLDTYAGLLYGMHPNIVMHVYPKDSAMLADLAAKRIAAGLAWQPSVATFQRDHPSFAPLNVRLLTDRHMVWNLVALYAVESQSAADTFNKGLQELAGSGGLQALTAPYAPPAAPAGEPASAQWPTAGFQPAYYARNSNAGVLLQVSEIQPKRTKAKPPALYTADQATKGSLAYYQNCAMCHGPNLDGQPGGYSGPALKGEDFADPSYDFHVSEIFNFVAKLMPAATPGSLTHEQDVQIMAFILQQNGYPAGNAELVYEVAEKSRTPIRYYGK